MLLSYLNPSGSFMNFFERATLPCKLVRCISMALFERMLIEVDWLERRLSSLYG